MKQELIISFTDQSNSFTNGVEFGRLIHKMEIGYSPIDNNNFPVHIENRKIINRACLYYNYLPIFSKCSVDGWIEFICIKGEAKNLIE